MKRHQGMEQGIEHEEQKRRREEKMADVTAASEIEWSSESDLQVSCFRLESGSPQIASQAILVSYHVY